MTKYVAVRDAITAILVAVDDDPDRQGLFETPRRVADAWLNTWASGYGKDPKDVLKTFEDGATGFDEMVFQGGITFWSTCEHHLAPFFGVAHIGYIPNGKVVGLSKLVRVLDIYARRLQVQERVCVQVADCLFDHLNALGVGVVLQCRHSCMESRGVHRAGTVTTTSALRGCMKDHAGARAEFLNMVNAVKTNVV